MSESPRILFISVFHPEIFRGGAQQAAYELFLGAREAGLDATFLASVEPGQAPALFKPGAIFTGFDGRPNEYLFLSDSYDHAWHRNLNIRALRWFEEFLLDLKPDIVHFHHFMTIGLDLFLVARRVLPKAKLVLTLHEFLGICMANGHMVRKNEKALCTKASPVRCHQCFPDLTPESFQLREDWVKHAYSVFDAFITPTEFVRRRYIEWGLAPEKVHTVTNAQADYSLRDYRVKIPASTAPRVPNRFGFFGQLVDVKGLGVVFDALDHYARTYEEPVQLHINGANLGHATEKFPGALQELPRECEGAGAGGAGRVPRPLFHVRSACPHGARRLGAGALDLVGDLRPGGVRGLHVPPPAHLQQYRRHGRAPPP
ncbi:glycosyltransferase [Siccirubricoccus sp. G192]|nr:glycosyltransferase [Siccirubricoccus sp. G192]